MVASNTVKRYRIVRTTGDVPLRGEIAGTCWEGAHVAAIDECPWDTGRDRQVATVRALYDSAFLYLRYLVEDEHSIARTTALNGPVWEDSAVECFFRPDPARASYINFEVNCAGTFHLGWGPDRENREVIPLDLARTIEVNTSIAGETKDPSNTDEGWRLGASIPFETLETFTNCDLTPRSGTVWRGNFQRLGGGSEFAVWNAIDASEPDFHRPRGFGRFVFA